MQGQIDAELLRMRMRKLGLTGRKAARILHKDESLISHALNGNRPALLEKLHSMVTRREARMAERMAS